MEYLDFNLAIGPGQGRAYPVTVHSPAGEAHVTMTFPFDTLALDNRLKDLQIALLSSGGTRRGLLPEEETVQTFGRELFDLLITGEVRSRYDVSQERARQQGKGLRLKLSIQPPTLAALPWEYLYDARTGAYICLALDTPIVRYLDLAQPIAPLAVTPPLRILGMVVSPRDLQRLDVQVEKQRVERAVKALQDQGLVELTWLAGQSWRELRRTLLGSQWQIFHFVGHGSFDSRHEEGTIALADGAGDARFFTATEFGHLLADHRSLRLVLLNACLGARGSKQDVFSSTAATLVRRGIPAVVAMQEAITDQAAIEFAQTFYENLASGLPVDAAVAEARKAILFEIANTLEWGTPVLYMRAADGRIFDLPSLPKPASEPTPSAPVAQPTHEQDTTRKPQATVRKTRVLWQWGVMVVLLLALGLGGFQYRDEIMSALGFGVGAPPPTTATPAPPTNTPAPTVTPTLMAGATRIKDDIIYVYIPAGEFMMGSGEEDTLAQGDEKPQHPVYVDAFWIMQTEVTNEHYQRCVDANGCTEPNNSRWDDPAYAERPVTNVTWTQANAYADWMDGQLPTEAQWEKACRGPDNSIYPWSNEPPTAERLNFNNNVRGTKEVSSYTAGTYGLYDMAGNVWEWTADWYNKEYYQSSLDRNPMGPEEGILRTLRGGSWLNSEINVRCASRNWSDPDFVSDSRGFRVVFSSPGF
ncbi:MAG: SUMF1/EgtB/PvdO family nonheme iron enzyme [Caldilineaceae bacterium]